MQCTTCSYMLQTGMAVCPNCGAPVTRYTTNPIPYITNPIPYIDANSGPTNPYAYSPYVESSSAPGTPFPSTSQPAYPNTPGAPPYTNPQYYHANPAYPNATYIPGAQMPPQRRFS